MYVIQHTLTHTHAYIDPHILSVGGIYTGLTILLFSYISALFYIFQYVSIMDLKIHVPNDIYIILNILIQNHLKI